MIMYTLNPLIDFPVTKFYFDTFVVGSYSSSSHLIRDLLNMKEVANDCIVAHRQELPAFKVKELEKLISLIDAELAKYDVDDELFNLEDSEPKYWVNRLARQSSLEISTYGRIRPETMNLLMCLQEDEFQVAMSHAGRLAAKIQNLGENSLSQNTPVPKNMPVI